MAKINQEKFVTMERAYQMGEMLGIPRVITEMRVMGSMHCAIPDCKGSCIFDGKDDYDTPVARQCTHAREEVMASLVTFDELMAMKEEDKIGND